MTANITPFDFHGNQVRTLTDEQGEPWFVAKDVCAILGYANPSKAIADHVDDEDKLNNETLSSLGQRGGWIVNESGLYSLIITSKMPNAKAFKRWVTHEVLPSIRKTGKYEAKPMSVEERALSIMGELKAIVDRQKLTIANQHEAISQLEPKAEAYDTFLDHTGLYKVGEAAKLLSNSGMPIGQNKLYEFMRDNGWVYRNHGKWTAYQRQVDMGHLYMKDHVTLGTDNNGNPFQYPPTVYVTRKGLNLLQRKLSDRNLERTLTQSKNAPDMIEISN